MFLINAVNKGATDDFWYEPVHTNTSGVRVTDETAMKLSAFWSCALVKAQTMSQLPLCLYRNINERGREKATDNDLYRLIHNRPNRFQTSYQWREMGQLHLDVRGNFYNIKVFDRRARVSALIPIHPDKVKIERIDDVTHRYLIQEDGRERTYGMGEIFHVAGPTLDGPEGLNPVEFHRETVGKSIATRDYGAQFYRNGATMPGWIEYPHTLQEEQRRRLGDSWQKAQTGTNKFKTPILDRGMQYHELSIKHTDLQYLESLKDEDIIIRQIMRVPPYKIYRMDQAKFSNVEQMEMDFVRNTLTPIATRWEQSMDAQLLDVEEAENHFFKFQMGGLLRGDTATRGDFYATALGSGGHEPFLTVNEIRELEDRNPIDGGDELPVVANSQRLEAFLSANADRCTTRMTGAAEKAVSNEADLREWSAEFFERHAEWVADVMQISQGAARKFCGSLADEITSAEDPHRIISNWKQGGAARLMEIAK